MCTLTSEPLWWYPPPGCYRAMTCPSSASLQRTQGFTKLIHWEASFPLSPSSNCAVPVTIEQLRCSSHHRATALFQSPSSNCAVPVTTEQLCCPSHDRATVLSISRSSEYAVNIKIGRLSFPSHDGVVVVFQSWSSSCSFPPHDQADVLSLSQTTNALVKQLRRTTTVYV